MKPSVVKHAQYQQMKRNMDSHRKVVCEKDSMLISEHSLRDEDKLLLKLDPSMSSIETVRGSLRDNSLERKKLSVIGEKVNPICLNLKQFAKVHHQQITGRN